MGREPTLDAEVRFHGADLVGLPGCAFAITELAQDDGQIDARLDVFGVA